MPCGFGYSANLVVVNCFADIIQIMVWERFSSVPNLEGIIFIFPNDKAVALNVAGRYTYHSRYHLH